MLINLNTVDAMRYSRWKRTIYLYIYDTDVWHSPQQQQEHIFYTRKKIEAYVDYILRGEPIKYFKLSERKKYVYKICFVTPEISVTGEYAELLDDCSRQLRQITQERIVLE